MSLTDLLLFFMDLISVFKKQKDLGKRRARTGTPSKFLIHESIKERQLMSSDFRVLKKPNQNDPKNQMLWGTNRRVW